MSYLNSFTFGVLHQQFRVNNFPSNKLLFSFHLAFWVDFEFCYPHTVLDFRLQDFFGLAVAPTPGLVSLLCHLKRKLTLSGDGGQGMNTKWTSVFIPEIGCKDYSEVREKG